MNLGLLPQNSYALDTNELKEKLRPYLEQYLGKDTSDSLIGEKIVEIKMPDIPEIKEDATNTDVYDHAKEYNVIPADKKQKLDYAFIIELFEATRMGKANDNEISRWMNVMNQGATREGIYRALVLDNTYAGLENYEKKPTDKVIKFTKFFLNKYVKQSIRGDLLQQMNFFTLKRVVAEKALEIIDAYGRDTNDLHKWYGILSFDLANKYPAVWKNRLRADNNFERHHNWAKEVPLQHLKSETVIKIHKVFNSLL